MPQIKRPISKTFEVYVGECQKNCSAIQDLSTVWKHNDLLKGHWPVHEIQVQITEPQI